MPQDSERKKITASIDLGPNYIYHILAVCRINFDSPYADKYADSVKPADVETMRNAAKMITFGGGQGGELIDFIVVPMSAGLGTRDEFREYYDQLDHAIGSGEYEPFIKRYGMDAEHFEPWFAMEHEDLKNAEKHRATLQEYGRVFTDNFDRYAETIWPSMKTEMEPVKTDIEAHFADTDVIEQWEAQTRITFKRDSFHPVLCSAIANGPNANSFAYDRVVFYHHTPRPKLLDLIVHEVGTHILIEPFKAMWMPDSPHRQDLYHAYECLASFMARRILGRSLNFDMPSYRQEHFDARITELLEANPKVPVAELLRELVEK